MDNRIFNVNGQREDHLQSALQLAFNIRWNAKAVAFKVVPEKGLVFYWHHDPSSTIPLLPGTTTDMLAKVAMEWLKSEEAKSMPMDGWDADKDHDGHNSLGWRVYCEDWGHVGSSPYAIVAVKPAYLWYGK
jgi:hypothetical protein